MNPHFHFLFITALALPLTLGAAELRFNQDVRPILSGHCFACHGPDAKSRKADLRLDVRDDALAVLAPRNAAMSEVIARISSHDEDEVMPPPKANKKLTPAQIEVLRRWITEGAKYERHWAFEPPVRGELQSIDAHVEVKLKEKGLSLAPEASRATLLRRVALDLTGLPPRAELVADFISGRLSYESAVDQLLGSSHFGEHLAVAWLDAARYADTNGYFGDKPRQMWLWRDWVIEAFNSNMPFDQFTIEQVAGDLLPEATVKQRVATGFNRNHMANNESGIIDEEFRSEYVVDRVSTTMTTWLGLTAGCAQCHDHKFDPISQREFYQLFAFFNNVPESGLITANDPPPLIRVPSPGQERELKKAEAEMREATLAFAPMKKDIAVKITAWEKDALRTLPAPPMKTVLHEALNEMVSQRGAVLGTTLIFEPGVRGAAAKFDATQHVETRVTNFDPDAPWSIGLWVKMEGSLSCPLSLIEPDGDRRGLELIWQKGRVQVNLVNRWGVSAIEVATVATMSVNAWHQIVLSYDGMQKAKGLRVFTDGTPMTLEVRRDTLRGSIANREPLRIGRRDSGLGFYGLIDEVRVVQTALDEQAVRDWFRSERIGGIVEMPSAKRTGADTETLLDDYIIHFADAQVREAHQRVRQAMAGDKKLRESIPTALVMQEMAKPRATHVMERGQYDKLGAAVLPGVPVAVAPWPADAARNRLGFAKWLVSKDHPLTARVAVNRLWQQCFGEGIVRTVDDFGSQGEAPTHPELLDWLAVTFRDSGWDVKAMMKCIVLSKTYRQQSAVRFENDPENRLLARGPGGRMSAEALRDQALAVAGLLVPTIGGPSVKPYQPPGLWEAVSYNGEESYVPGTGGDLWRRSLYTYIKRQSPPPALLTFDGPTREKCTMRRPRTNTPLQALQLLNDDTFVEAARVLAERVLAAQRDDEARLRQLWRQVLIRDADADEIAMLRGLLQRQRERFENDSPSAAWLLSVGAAPRDPKLDAREHAAWTVVAQSVLNLDETISKQ